jgi:hypothetical protein
MGFEERGMKPQPGINLTENGLFWKRLEEKEVTLACLKGDLSRCLK